MYLVAPHTNIALPVKYENAYEAYETYSAPSDVSSFMSTTVEEFQVGSTKYKFLKPYTLVYSLDGSKWLSRIPEVPFFEGNGNDLSSSLEDLKIALHVEFQRLYRKRPFQMSQEEKTKWKYLSNTIDILSYKLTTPIITQEIGQVSFGKINRPDKIKWISGHTYKIDPFSVPSDLMTCVTGQWIEASLEREPIKHSITQIITIKKIHFRIPNEDQRKQFWESIPKMNQPAHE